MGSPGRIRKKGSRNLPAYGSHDGTVLLPAHGASLVYWRTGALAHWSPRYARKKGGEAWETWGGIAWEAWNGKREINPACGRVPNCLLGPLVLLELFGDMPHVALTGIASVGRSSMLNDDKRSLPSLGVRNAE